ncbi:hypothetical protein DYBT9275_03345 [Dyadobacter sp. CECT 9275]|uniref:YtxH domain-containing protein n=1 Tax=Dyadobacter helix TaxID=2822344 RepID=A0A916JFZ3_9BACT|nr:YtxH domain-containing protein [Dyadobacter sp. CECT 9275]CAG5004314.1 hypothetical protein DYBT9275_03345 [Dyadobacter sp. CECT 9275]
MNNKAFWGIVTAAAVGAVIGLLFAPEDGDKTRKKIKRKTNSLASELLDALEKSKAKADQAASELKNKGQEYADKAAFKVNEVAEEVNSYR